LIFINIIPIDTDSTHAELHAIFGIASTGGGTLNDRAAHTFAASGLPNAILRLHIFLVFRPRGGLLTRWYIATLIISGYVLF
jgi:hypothetical protein